jgi:hypothetical protein
MTNTAHVHLLAIVEVAEELGYAVVEVGVDHIELLDANGTEVHVRGGLLTADRLREVLSRPPTRMEHDARR